MDTACTLVQNKQLETVRKICALIPDALLIDRNREDMLYLRCRVT